MLSSTFLSYLLYTKWSPFHVDVDHVLFFSFHFHSIWRVCAFSMCVRSRWFGQVRAQHIMANSCFFHLYDCWQSIRGCNLCLELKWSFDELRIHCRKINPEFKIQLFLTAFLTAKCMRIQSGTISDCACMARMAYDDAMLESSRCVTLVVPDRLGRTLA